MIEQSTIAALETAPNIEALLDGYRAEGAIDGLPAPMPRWDIYKTLEAKGLLHVFAARSDGVLAGFIILLFAPHPHYLEPLATSESFFVAKTHRMSRLWLKLLKAVEDKATALGAPAFRVSAPLGGRLCEVLPRMGYVATNQTFLKRLERNSIAVIPAMSDAAIATVRRMESMAAEQPQVAIATVHRFHAGLYARTIKVPSGVMITGVLVKVATLLVVDGDCLAYIGNDQPLHLKGHQVLPASAGRKQAFFALQDTTLTMILASAAKTVDEVEREFTDEADILLSHRGVNRVLVTGE